MEEPVSLPSSGSSVNQIGSTATQSQHVHAPQRHMSNDGIIASTDVQKESPSVTEQGEKIIKESNEPKDNVNGHIPDNHRLSVSKDGISNGHPVKPPIPKKPERWKTNTISKPNQEIESQAHPTEKQPPLRPLPPLPSSQGLNRPTNSSKGLTPPPLPTTPSPPAYEHKQDHSPSDDIINRNRREANLNGIQLGLGTKPLSKTTDIAPPTQQPADLPKDSKYAKAYTRLGNITQEIIESEKTYGKSLSDLKSTAEQMMNSKNKEIQAFGKQLRAAVLPLVESNYMFINDLKTQVTSDLGNTEKSRMVRETYEKHIDNYYAQLSNFIPQMQDFNNKMQELSQKFKKDMSPIEKNIADITKGLGFQSLTANPVQRGPRHELFLREMTETTTTISPNFGGVYNHTLDAVKTKVAWVNEKVRNSSIEKSKAEINESLANGGKPTEKLGASIQKHVALIADFAYKSRMKVDPNGAKVAKENLTKLKAEKQAIEAQFEKDNNYNDMTTKIKKLMSRKEDIEKQIGRLKGEGSKGGMARETELTNDEKQELAKLEDDFNKTKAELSPLENQRAKQNAELRKKLENSGIDAKIKAAEDTYLNSISLDKENLSENLHDKDTNAAVEKLNNRMIQTYEEVAKTIKERISSETDSKKRTELRANLADTAIALAEKGDLASANMIISTLRQKPQSLSDLEKSAKIDKKAASELEKAQSQYNKEMKTIEKKYKTQMAEIEETKDSFEKTKNYADKHKLKSFMMPLTVIGKSVAKNIDTISQNKPVIDEDAKRIVQSLNIAGSFFSNQAG